MNLIKLTLILMLFPGALVSAETALDLTPEDFSRLNITFAPVVPASRDAGPSVPAEVITSPDSRSALIAPYEGIVEQWLVKNGESVSLGQALVKIASQSVVEHQQAWMAANTRFTQATENLERDRRLFDEGVIAAKRLAQTERSQERARFDLDAITALLARAGIRGDDLNKLAAGVITPGTYYVTAPVDGILANRSVDAGAHIDAQGKVGMVHQNGEPWLRAQVPTAVAREVRQGQPLTLAEGAQSLTLRQIARAVTSATQTVEILASFDSPSALYPGQVVTLILPRTGGGQVPASALVHNGDQTLVFVRTPGGVDIRQVGVVPAGDHYLAVSGVVEGEQVAVTGTALLKGMVLGLGGDQ